MIGMAEAAVTICRPELPLVHPTKQIIININTTAIDYLWIVMHIWNAPYGRRHVGRFISRRVSVAGSHGPVKPAACWYRQGKL